jgi:large subunit ribosomal protein L9
MKVVLLADVKKIGRKYDVAKVSDGYGLNFLLPQKKAIAATSQKIKWAENMKNNEVSSKEIQATLLAKNIDSIKSAVIEISEKVNDQGHLFAGIHEADLAKALTEKTGIEIDSDFIKLDKAIKEVGEHEIKVVAGDAEATFKLIITAAE